MATIGTKFIARAFVDADGMLVEAEEPLTRLPVPEDLRTKLVTEYYGVYIKKNKGASNVTATKAWRRPPCCIF